MKNILYLLPFLVLWASCADRSFLDETVTTDLNHDAVFADSTLTVGFLTNIYREIGFDVNPSRFSSTAGTFGGLQTACDEAKYREVPTITADRQFVLGTINPVIITDDVWTKCYENIRRANVFRSSVDASPLSAELKKTYKAEARFLRAWYYFILLRHYGGVPMVGDNIYGIDDEIPTERNTFEECVNYIVTECEAAALDLSVKPAGKNNGRIGSGACLSLISRVRLYAASPLFNGSDWGKDVLGADKAIVGYPDYDANRWKLAMDAAERLITIGAYSLYVKHDPTPGYGFYSVMLPGHFVGTYIEIILEQKADRSTGTANLFAPPSRSGHQPPGGFPYQGLVDAFPMKNGKPINDPESNYLNTSPYADRDPRFYHTIVFDQTTLPSKSISPQPPVNIFYPTNPKEGVDADAVTPGRGTTTGYYIKKFIGVHDNGFGANDIHGNWQGRPLMRFGEILLNYAEARNEFSGPSSEVYLALTQLRERAGIAAGDNGMYGLQENMTQEEMRDAIRNERRIELAFEGHRFFDVRRWMIADVTENRQMTGMRPEKQLDGTKTYIRFNVLKHIFGKQMYLWPFPDKEVAKSTLLKQNPYYN